MRDVWLAFQFGETGPVPGFEAPGVRRAAMRARPHSVTELANLIAIYRPGTIQAGFCDLYLARAHWKPDTRTLDSVLWEMTSATRGLFLFREQLLEVYDRLLEVPASRADFLSRGMNLWGDEGADELKCYLRRACETHEELASFEQELFELLRFSANHCFSNERALTMALNAIAAVESTLPQRPRFSDAEAWSVS